VPTIFYIYIYKNIKLSVKPLDNHKKNVLINPRQGKEILILRKIKLFYCVVSEIL